MSALLAYLAQAAVSAVVVAIYHVVAAKPSAPSTPSPSPVVPTPPSTGHPVLDRLLARASSVGEQAVEGFLDKLLAGVQSPAVK